MTVHGCRSERTRRRQTGDGLRDDSEHYEASVGGIGVHRGQPGVFTAYADNHSTHPVRILALALVHVPGYASGRLAHTGRILNINTLGAGRGWHPHDPDVPLGPLVGATLPPGKSYLAWAITGNRPGTVYADAGLQLTYRHHGHLTHATAYGGGSICIVARPSAAHPCGPAGSRAADAILNFIDSR